MTSYARLIVEILAVIIGAPILGAFLMGVDRKITARMQSRQGPPLLQPFYDLIKLFRKDAIAVNRIQIVYAYLHLAFMVLACVLFVLGQDSLMLLFVLAFSTLSLVMGGMCVRSPYSRIGSQREIIMMVAYEPILILMVVGYYLTNGSFTISDAFHSSKPLIQTLPLLFIAFVMVVAVKWQKSPFDLATSHHAHQEIVKGITIEYSGPYLGVIELAHCYEVALFFVWIGLFGATHWLLGAALAVAAFFMAIVMDNLMARLTTMWMFRFMWTIALGLAMTNILWLYVK